METDIPHRKRCKRQNIPGHAHELTFSCIRRQKLLTEERTVQYIADAVMKAKEKHGFSVWAYVIMPEHAHLIVKPDNESYSISDIMASIKQSVARREMIYTRKHNPGRLALFETGQRDTRYRFWLDGGGYDRNIIEIETLHKAVEYIHYNPVRRGLVETAVDWKWSSAGFWLEGKEGIIKMDRETFPI